MLGRAGGLQLTTSKMRNTPGKIRNRKATTSSGLSPPRPFCFGTSKKGDAESSASQERLCLPKVRSRRVTEEFLKPTRDFLKPTRGTESRTEKCIVFSRWHGQPMHGDPSAHRNARVFCRLRLSFAPPAPPRTMPPRTFPVGAKAAPRRHQKARRTPTRF